MSIGYYLYTISSNLDCTEETFRRRQLKKNQGFHSGFLFDLSVGTFDFDQALKFVKTKVATNDAVQFHFQNFDREYAGKSFIVITSMDEFEKSIALLKKPQIFLVVKCLHKKILNQILLRLQTQEVHIRERISLMAENYNSENGHMISAKDYLSQLKDKGVSGLIRRDHQLPFWNRNIQINFELEPIVGISWEKKLLNLSSKAPEVSVIIPTYNNSRFLINVVTHLAQQAASTQDFEVIIVDDGSEDGTSEILQRYLQSHELKINLKYIYWSKKDQGRGAQNFFRPGQARNLAATFAAGTFLIFLDSDMLVPPDFIQRCLMELNQNDLIQFQRYHISQSLSVNNPKLQNVSIKNDCYTEEKHYWEQLFNCSDWNDLPNKWKYVCTYALGLKKKDFFEYGRIKRHFISYGFEDTDLGFRYYKRNKRFKLVQMPLLHLTNYSQMQYKNSFLKRHELLSVTAKLIFLDHLDLEIGTTLQTFLGGEKTILQKIKDHF